MSTFEEILAAYQLPDGEEKTAKLATVFDGADLDAVAAEALEKFKSFDLGKSGADYTAEELQVMQAVAAVTRDARAKSNEQKAAASERADIVSRLAEEINSITADGGDEDEVPEPEVVEEAPEVVSKELVTASVKKPSVQIDLAKMPFLKEEKKGKRLYTVAAAADIPGVPAGSDVSELMKLSSVAASKFDALRRTGGKGRSQSGIASIYRNRPQELTLSSGDSLDRAFDVVNYATSQSRLAGGNLLAAGGWCAPSETIYELCDPASMDGLVDIPEITASRGGVRFPAGLDFSSIYAGVGHQTEAEAIAGTAKTCIDIPCPTFTDVRLDIVYLCLTAPILTNRAYPELIRNFIANSLAALAHRANALKLAKMVAASEALTLDGADPAINPNYGTATTSLEYVAYAASWIRYRHRLGANSVLEAVFPLWAKEAFRADLSKKNGVDLFDMTDARIDAYFRARNIRVQWVYDWQDALSTGTATNWGGTPVPATGNWPTTVSGLIYPAGTFFALTSDVITLDGVYDSAGLTQNEYTALFTEEGVNVAKQCFTSINLTFPVCNNGLSGAQSAPACSNMPATLTEAVTP